MRRIVVRRFLAGGLIAGTLVAGTAAPAVAAPPGPSQEVVDAVQATNHRYGTVVDDADIAAALGRIGLGYGTVVDPGDVNRLLAWYRQVRHVIETAKAQVGAPYRWGGSGPDAFDCSGLTYFSYRAVGVTLPRSSRHQAAALRSVPMSDLRPGDLLFYRRPVGHVAIYVGDGYTVDAPGSGRTVQLVPRRLLERSDLVKVGRVIG